MRAAEGPDNLVAARCADMVVVAEYLVEVPAEVVYVRRNRESMPPLHHFLNSRRVTCRMWALQGSGSNGKPTT